MIEQVALPEQVPHLRTHGLGDQHACNHPYFVFRVVLTPFRATGAFSELARITRRELRGLSKQVQSFAMLTLSMGKAMSAGEQKKHLNL